MPQEPVAGQEDYAFERSGLFEEVGCPGHDLEPGFPAMEKRAAGRIKASLAVIPPPRDRCCPDRYQIRQLTSTSP
jgi:hypothetical protein